jgi:hypothetical protein
VALALGALGLAARRAPAKEHTAACPELFGMITRVRASLLVAGGQRQRGSSLGAYQVLRTTTDSLARDSGGRRCGALGPTLTAALTRAAASETALDASITLDQGLDAALSLATEGRLPSGESPAKLLPVGEAALYAQGCPDLFPLTVRLDGPGGTMPERVASLLADLRQRPRCERVRHVLEDATPERLAHAVDSIRLDEPDTEDGTAALGHRCPELPLVLDKLGNAIAEGAPRFNKGDATACRRVYEAAARAITTQVMAEGRCPAARSLLAAGLARAKGAPDDQAAAWDLRHSFDAILTAGPDAAP